MKRRQFIQTGSLISLPVLLGGLEVTAVSRSSLFNLVNSDDDKVLVLIQLNGGNDGLNMVIPLDQYSGLNMVRPNLVLPENKVLKLRDNTGLHPQMPGMKQLYDEGKLAVLQSVGYPDQNRSHFRSTDIWTSGSDSDEYVTTGWLGRYLDLKFPGYPVGFPNTDHPDPFAITLGTVVSETCQGPSTNYSFALVNQASVRIIEETVAAPSDPGCYGAEVDFIKTSIRQSNDYASTVLQAFDQGNSMETYPDTNLGRQLQMVANLISGGLKTKIYVVSIGGFDTHANQVLIDDTENGNHATLLNTVSEAVHTFTKDLEKLGVNERVMGMTFSEFGRQIRANNSYGTDHGTAAPLFVFGSCVDSKIYGENPEIDNNIAQQEGVPMQFDFRSVYATMLVSWLGASESQVRDVLFKDFTMVPFIKDCSQSTSVLAVDESMVVKVSPNPATDNVEISWESRGGVSHISIMNTTGALVENIMERTTSPGIHKLNVSIAHYSKGSYFVYIREGNLSKTIKWIKI
ncbi:MAG: DUF1501 domain-containing protein [Saprospiraceae bacterium]